MTRQVIYWVTTGLVALGAFFAALAYLTGAPQAVTGFAHVGYPQQLRVLLGLAKLAGAITLLVPGFPKVKEWAYAGFTFTWIAAALAHYLAGDGPIVIMPITDLVLLGISYMTRPESRRWPAKPAFA
jgi:DoxX-like family